MLEIKLTSSEKNRRENVTRFRETRFTLRNHTLLRCRTIYHALNYENYSDLEHRRLFLDALSDLTFVGHFFLTSLERLRCRFLNMRRAPRI